MYSPPRTSPRWRGANETARVASRGILDAARLDPEDIEVFPLTEGDSFAWAQSLDELVYNASGAVRGVLDDVLDDADDLVERVTGHRFDEVVDRLFGG